MTNDALNMPKIYYEPVNGRKPKPDEKVVLCFERTRAALAPVDVEGLKDVVLPEVCDCDNFSCDLRDGAEKAIDHLAARGCFGGPIEPDEISNEVALAVREQIGREFGCCDSGTLGYCKRIFRAGYKAMIKAAPKKED